MKVTANEVTEEVKRLTLEITNMCEGNDVKDVLDALSITAAGGILEWVRSGQCDFDYLDLLQYFSQNTTEYLFSMMDQPVAH